MQAAVFVGVPAPATGQECWPRCRTVVYKGMFVAPQFERFYPDLSDPEFESALAVIHQRYSTNTFPSWPLAQPFRYIAHNGEINTLRGNINKMNAREKTMSSPLFGEEIGKLKPVIQPGQSDSGIFDNVLELLVQGGRSLEHALMMIVPEAFGPRYHMSEDKRGFYEYHASIMEPWERPASGALGGHPQRPGGPGLRGGRARHSPRGRAPEGKACAGQDVPRGHGASPTGGGWRQTASS